MIELVSKMLEASGGLQAWQDNDEVVVTGQVGGFILRLKSKFDDMLVMEARISTKKQQTILKPFPKPGFRGIFEEGNVRIEKEDGSEVVRSRENCRPLFLTFPSSLRRVFYWDELDVLYFVGYSFYNYFSQPFHFTFDGVKTEELTPKELDGVTYRRLAVLYPPTFHTHADEKKVTTFWVNKDFFVHKFQYTAEVVGNWAKVDQCCLEYKKYEAFSFSSGREVFLQKDVFLRGLRWSYGKKTLAMHGNIYTIKYEKHS